MSTLAPSAVMAGVSGGRFRHSQLIYQEELNII
jgi:hypothetical protein